MAPRTHRPYRQRARTSILDITRAQRLKIWISLAHRLRNHHAQLLDPRKIWLKWPLRGPRSDFLGFLAHFAAPQKNTSAQTPKKPKNAEKLKMRQNEAVSANIFAQDHTTNLLRLTGEQIFFRFWIDEPEIWPGQKSRWGGLASPPGPIISM